MTAISQQTQGRTKRMQATARRLSVVSATSCARRRLIRNVGQNKNNMGHRLEPHQNELYRRVDEVLSYLWDPIGVAGIPEARDEYHGYLCHVFSMLVNGSVAGAIANYLNEVEGDRMGLTVTDGTRAKAHEIESCLRNYHEVIYERAGIEIKNPEAQQAAPRNR